MDTWEVDPFCARHRPARALCACSLAAVDEVRWEPARALGGVVVRDGRASGVRAGGEVGGVRVDSRVDDRVATLLLDGRVGPRWRRAVCERHVAEPRAAVRVGAHGKVLPIALVRAKAGGRPVEVVEEPVDTQRGVSA
jgi:hypothetical protein